MADNATILGDEKALIQIIEDDFSATDGHFEDSTVTSLRNCALRKKTTLRSVYLPNVTYIGHDTMRDSTNLVIVKLPKLTSYHNTGYAFFGNSNLEFIDWGMCRVAGNTFVNCTNLKHLVLRDSVAVHPCMVTTVFNGTPFASGGSGGTIYIPKSLYNHLGDGTEYDYKSATNWATYDGYGTITWEILEDYTIDGTTTGEFEEALLATPTNPMYAVTNLDVSVDDTHQKYITTTNQGHVTLSTGTFSSEDWSSYPRIQGDEIGTSVSGSYFSVPSGSTIKMVIKNMTATEWNSVNSQRNQIDIRLNRSGATLLGLGWSELKEAFYTNGLQRLEKSYTNTGTSAISVAWIDLYGTLTSNNTLDFGLMILIDDVRVV